MDIYFLFGKLQRITKDENGVVMHTSTSFDNISEVVTSVVGTHEPTKQRSAFVFGRQSCENCHSLDTFKCCRTFILHSVCF